MAFSENDTNKDKNRKILLYLVIFLLITNCATVILYFTKRSETVRVVQQLVSTTNLKVELDQKINEYKAKIQSYTGQINEKDSTLVAYKAELDLKVQEIQEKIKDANISKDKYEDAKQEIDGLKYYIEKYQKQIDELKKQNVVLTKENTNLKQDITKSRQVMDNLQDENVKLSNKVSLGAKLISGSINIMGIQVKESGKQKETNKGSKMDGMKISFNLKNNIMAEVGFYDFFIRILNPKGETLFIEGTGSGKFQYQGSEALYTTKERLEFTNNESKIYTIYWSKGSPFEKGNYKTEIYSQGLLIGQNAFEVK